jgi:hypothetical protein
MVTRSQRKLRKTIKILGNSVELSSKETKAKFLEKSYKMKIKKDYGIGDYPVQNLADVTSLKKIKNRK